MKINNIYNGNSIEILKTFPEESIDLILTSPPYDDLRYYGSNKNEVETFWNYEVFQEIAKECARVLKKGGVIVWIVGDATVKGSETGTSFRQALYFKEECKLNIHDTMIYEKNSFSFPAKGRCHQIFEYMFVFSKGKTKTFNHIEDRVNKYFGIEKWGTHKTRGKEGVLEENKFQGLITTKPFGGRTNIWKYSTGGNMTTSDKIAFQHPAVFPERIAYDNILCWSNEGEIVLDPFCGSGTTIKCAKILNRNYLGIELNKEYIPIIEERLKIAESIKEKKYKEIMNQSTINDLINKLENEKKDINKRLEILKKYV